ncbi:SGNH/GDSL hydrolase family protein [Janibacter sp. GXQ6167]|uniref:SGNH/GDSL hydrolase family protein n=1 Tax=Janibacter sp. GXQ6167 TaxID=3240791 RepID=UPI00352382B2
MTPSFLRRARTSATVIAATCALVALPSVGASAASTAEEPGEIVAMGDSWAAGSWVAPIANDAPALCFRSAENAGALIAKQHGLALTDVTCGGAQTKDFRGQQYPWVKPQLAALKPTTDYVVLNIGGNDNQTFLAAGIACLTAAPTTLYSGSPCKKIYGSRFVDKINAATYPAVKQVLQDIRAKAPSAKIAILGYQDALPPTFTKRCQALMPFAEGDFAYIREVQDTLNSAVKRAATETGATYVDMPAVSIGHDACSGRENRWVAPINFSVDNIAIVHPSALGNRAMAEQAAAALGL